MVLTLKGPFSVSELHTHTHITLQPHIQRRAKWIHHSLQTRTTKSNMSQSNINKCLHGQPIAQNLIKYSRFHSAPAPQWLPDLTEPDRNMAHIMQQPAHKQQCASVALGITIRTTQNVASNA